MSAKLVSAPADRNKAPILEVLKRVLPHSGLVLEIASGSGQHVSHFAKALPNLVWQPSDADAQARRSIDAWIAEERLANIHAPIDLDVLVQPWPLAACDALVCINMIHISPWAATQALFEGAATVLPAKGTIFLYGPYRMHGAHTAPSNAAFDAMLRGQNPQWGVRDLEEVVETARSCGFEWVETIAMPANNLSVIFRRMSHGHGSGIDRAE
jgi:cyclopropane fatty-acyl-phospholipid synthase-like methyltransferase